MPQNGIPRSEEDFLRMQQEAVLRVREMQQRARRTLEDAGIPMEQPPAEPPLPAQDSPAEQASSAEQPPAGSGSAPLHEAAAQGRAPHASRGGLAGLPLALGAGKLPLPLLNLSLDTEQILILIMIFMIYQDHGDKWLMLALGYILL